MAGRGPAPKDESQRRRRNEPARGEWVDLEPLAETVIPDLKDAGPEREWHSRTLALWSGWQDDPATAMYGPAEKAAIVELAYLTDEFVTGGDPGFKFQRVTPAELRQRMDGLGLTAKGKRDLRWRTVAETAAAAAGPCAPALVAQVRPLRAV
jgi:hypothetical protein